MTDQPPISSAVPGALVRPSGWQRFFSTCLDWAILFPIILLIALEVSTLMHSTAAVDSEVHQRDMTLIVHTLGLIYLLAALVAIFYYSIFHAWKGQTIGKMVCKLRLVNLDGSHVSWRKALARSIVYYGLTFIYCIIFFTANVTAIGIAGFIETAWVLIDMSFQMIDRCTQRSLHDRICGTRVIKEAL